MATSFSGRSLDDALRLTVDQSDVPALLQLVQQVLQRTCSGAELTSSVGATALCLMGQKQLAAKVAGYMFYEWLARSPDRSAVLGAVGVLGVNALRKDSTHAAPAVRAAVVRAAAAAAVGTAARRSGGELVTASQEVLARAATDTSAFVRRAAAAMQSQLPRDEDDGTVAAATTAGSRLHELTRDSDPLVAVTALGAHHVGSDSRTTAMPPVTREQCLYLLDGVVSGAYPEFTRVSALKLACCHRLVDDGGSGDGSLYDLLDRLDPLLQSQDPCITLAAADAFAAYAVHLPASARQDAAARLADASLRLAAHPDQRVVAAVLRWLAERPDLERFAACFGRGGGAALSLFYCKPADGVALKRRKIDVLRRLAALWRDSVAEIADHLLAQVALRSGGQATVSSAAIAAVAQLGRLDDGCRDACRAAIDRHLSSCGAAALASTIACCRELESLAPPASLGRALDTLMAPANKRLLLDDSDVAAAAAWLAAECCLTCTAAPAVVALLAERAFPDPSSLGQDVRVAAESVPLRLAVVSASVKCYFKRPSAASREVVGRVLGMAASCDSAMAKEQALLYYRLMREDVDCCRTLVLGADECVGTSTTG